MRSAKIVSGAVVALFSGGLAGADGLPGPTPPAAARHVRATAAWVAPAKAGANCAVEVHLTPVDPDDIRVNEDPAPRLALAPDQKVLVDRQPPRRESGPVTDPDATRYLDPAKPVAFPAALATGATKGFHDVTAQVTFFYCSKRQGWCRKGTSEVAFQVQVR